jgi:hypothetical protein
MADPVELPGRAHAASVALGPGPAFRRLCALAGGATGEYA